MKRLEFCAKRFIRVPAHRLKDPQLVWLNPDARDLIADLPYVNTGVPNWILESFAWGVADQGAGDFLVDYYGSSGMTSFGGSGRAGIIGGMQVKGIGVTPLVASNADWQHSHGRLFLEEAIREAIFSEMAAKEFPYGATRTLAVISTGETLVDPAGKKHPCGLLVRPFVVRASHLERAFCYGLDPNSFGRSFHIKDIARIREWSATCDFSNQRALDNYASRAGSQIAHAHVMRWFHGGWYSSVLSLDGALIDFGSCRRVVSWKQENFENYGPQFGAELHYAETTIRSIAQSLSYLANASVNAGAALNALHESYDVEIISECKRVLRSYGLGAASVAEGAVMTSKFKSAFRRAQYAQSDELSIAVEMDFWRDISCLDKACDSVDGMIQSMLMDRASTRIASRENVQSHVWKWMSECEGMDALKMDEEIQSAKFVPKDPGILV